MSVMLTDPPALTADGQIGYNGLVFGSGTSYVIAETGITGWEDLPGFDTADSPRSGDHGSWPGPRYAQPRVITATVWLAPATRTDTSAITALRGATGIDLDEQWLTVQLHGETLISAVRINQRAIPTDRQFALYGVAKASVQFIATDPRRYTLTLQTLATSVPQPETGIVWPLTWPLSWGTAGSSGNLQVTNAGNAATHPVVTFTGPCTDPQLANVDTGQMIGYNLVLAATDVLTVDTGSGQVLLNGAADRRYAAMPNATLEEAFVLPPGSTTLAFRPSAGAPPASAKVAWRSAYM
ncbi:hypothetical protein ABH935_008526 [Catenulispora sp. GAS73]|uniref:phage distal tail protein n=1 Tax=Catenulispora sp. GAS73 TaxID=3156269 RepID=UPI00351322EE